MARGLPALTILLAVLLIGTAGCKGGIPDDGRYQGYGGPNRGGAETGLPVTPYDPYAR